MFGALVILLLLMALAVALTRLRMDRSGLSSPYGGLAAVSSAAPPGSAAVPAAAAPAPPATMTAALTATPAPVADAPAVTPLPVATTAPRALAQAAVPPVVAQATPAPPVVAPAAGPGPAAARAPLAAQGDPDAQRGGARQIAMSKADIGAAPQPAPVALVAAAARAASAPARPALPAMPAPERVAALSTTADQTGPSGRININTASADELNGIGAGHIGRTIVRHRPYRSLDDLVSHRVLKARDFARIRAAISVD